MRAWGGGLLVGYFVGLIGDVLFGGLDGFLYLLPGVFGAFLGASHKGQPQSVLTHLETL